MVPLYSQCLQLWCLTISHAYWCVASQKVMPSGVVPHYQLCLLVCCLTINNAFWCGALSSTMPVGMVPHYRPCLLAWYPTIGQAFCSTATAINILLVECRWKKGGCKSGATCTEVPLYQTCLMIQCTPRYACLYTATISDMHAGFMNSSTLFCKVLLYPARYLVCFK